jgi:hypothetical protein
MNPGVLVSTILASTSSASTGNKVGVFYGLKLLAGAALGLFEEARR